MSHSPAVERPAEGTDEADVRRRNGRLGRRLGFVVVLMIAFAPFLYWSGGLICDWAGIGFNPDRAAMASGGTVDGRQVDCIFTAIVSDELDGKVRFTVEEATQVAGVGDPSAGRNVYSIENLTDHPLFIRPIHFVSPAQASRAFRMTECFCYNDMELAPGEQRELPVVYGFRADMDARVAQALINYSVQTIPEVEMRPTVTMPDEGNFAPDAEEEGP